MTLPAPRMWRISQPHGRSYLTELRDVARQRESAVDDLCSAFGREPSTVGLPPLEMASTALLPDKKV
jgi:hypothetical protein